MQSLQEESERCTTNANKIDQKMNKIYIPWICKLFDCCAGMFLFNRINITSRSSLSLPKTSTSFPATASLASRCGARQWKRWKTAPTARSSVTTHASPSFDASRFYGDRTRDIVSKPSTIFKHLQVCKIWPISNNFCPDENGLRGLKPVW